MAVDFGGGCPPGVALAVLALSISPTTAVAQSPQFRGEPAHTGSVETTGPRDMTGVAWRFRTGGAVRTSPALHDGVLYVGSGDGRLYALDAESGELHWSADTGSPIASSPAVSEGVVMVSSRDGTLRGVSIGDGEPLWQVESGPDLPLPWGREGWDYIHSSPSIAGGTVYWGTGDGRVLAIDPAGGRIEWTYRTSSRVRSTPAVSGDLLVVGDSDGWIHALDARTGERRWRFETDGVSLVSADFGFDRRQITASPAIAGDEVIVGSRDASLYSLDASDGSLNWRYDESSAWVIASAAVGSERVYSARSSSGNVRALDRTTGEELWSFSAGGFVFSSPVLVDDVVYMGQGDGEVTAHDADTGETLWSYRLGATTYSTPVVHDGRLYIGDDAGRVHALTGGEGPGWERAVYYAEELASRSVLGGAPEHARIRDYFVGRGYEEVDGGELGEFLDARILDGAPSVVVFAMDGLPEGTDEPGGAMARYLEAGGKVVWLSTYPPRYLLRDEDGRPGGRDADRTAELLGVDVSALHGDHYTTTPTEAGRRWGLESWWVGVGQTMPEEVDVVLARDELGRAVAWAVSYGGPEGTGFVQARAGTAPALLEEVQRVAEYGLGPTAGEGR